MITHRNALIFLLAVSILMPLLASAQTVVVDATPSHVANTFSPLRALGTTVDRIPTNTTDIFFEPDQIKQILEAGWGPVTYRQNTELFVEAWHWNPKGTWSDPAGKGYFVGDATPTKEMIRHSFSYNLPHRGVTRNSGSEFDGYSRLDDGDLEHLLEEQSISDESLHGRGRQRASAVGGGRTRKNSKSSPQYELPGQSRMLAITKCSIGWARGMPWMIRCKATWKDFPAGVFTEGKGGTVTLSLSPTPLTTKFVRILMTDSSNTCDTHGCADPRNCVGYAIKEIYAGKERNGQLHDILQHSPGQDQTLYLFIDRPVA